MIFVKLQVCRAVVCPNTYSYLPGLCLNHSFPTSYQGHRNREISPNLFMRYVHRFNKQPGFLNQEDLSGILAHTLLPRCVKVQPSHKMYTEILMLFKAITTGVNPVCFWGKNTSTHFGLVIFCQGCIVSDFFFLGWDCPKNVMFRPVFLYFLYKDIAINF